MVTRTRHHHVSYPLEPSLGFRVPVEMRERYDTPSPQEGGCHHGLASYSGFRGFDGRTLMQPNPAGVEPAAQTPPPATAPIGSGR
jgi:hypothetical protein